MGKKERERDEREADTCVICVCRPENPLQVLGEFLLQRSRDLEGVKLESTG